LSQHRRRLTGGRRPRRSRRSVRAFLLTTVVAAVVIALGARFMISQVSVTDPLALAATDLAHSREAAKLVQQRQNIILMTAATKSFKIVGHPKEAKKPVPVAANGASGSGGGGGTPIVASAPPNPGTAEAIAYNMLPSFGFSHNQFGCLNNIWTRESGWRYNAENASGAYGIPQALPGSKMASAGADWLTNPATQIRWGLGYIQSIYGTPCGAWGFWQVHGWY
jgi:hypothetical protein